MSVPKVRIKIVHPFVKIQNGMELELKEGSFQSQLDDFLKNMISENRHSFQRINRENPLEGCVVLNKGREIGYIDENGFQYSGQTDNHFGNCDEIVITLPVAGG